MWRFTTLDTVGGALGALLLFFPLAGGYVHTAMATSESTAKTSFFNPLFWMFALTLILVLCAAGWSAASVNQSKRPDRLRKTGIGGPNDPMA